MMSLKAKAFFAAIGLLLAHSITAQDCLAAISDDKLALACTNSITDTLSFNGNDTVTWDTVLSEASNTTSSWQVVIQGVNFVNATSSTDRLLTLLSSAPDNSTVSLSLNECTMEEEKYVNMQAYTMPAASYSIQISNSTLASNNLAFVNILGFPAGLDMSLDISESVVASNNVTLSALVGSLADAFLTITIDDASDVSENMLGLSGVAGVAGDGEGVATILGSTVSGNSIEAGLMLAFGGNASWTVESGSEDGSNNTIYGPIFAVTEQPMVQIALDFLTSLSSSSSNTNTTTLDIASLSDLLLPMLKSQACSTWTHLVNKASSYNTTTPLMSGNDTDDKDITTLEDIEKEKLDTLDDLLDDKDDDGYDDDDLLGFFDEIFGGKDKDGMGMIGHDDDDDDDDDKDIDEWWGGDKGGTTDWSKEILRPAPFLVNDTMTELLGCPTTVTDLWNTTTDIDIFGGGFDIGALLSSLLGNATTGTTDWSKQITALVEGLLGNGTSIIGEKDDDDDNGDDLFGGLFGGLFDDLDDDNDDNTGDGGLFGGLGGLFGSGDGDGDVGGLGKIFDDLFGGGLFGGGGLDDDDDNNKGVGGGGSNWWSDLLGELGVAPGVAPSPAPDTGVVDDGTKL